MHKITKIFIFLSLFLPISISAQNLASKEEIVIDTRLLAFDSFVFNLDYLFESYKSFFICVEETLLHREYEDYYKFSFEPTLFNYYKKTIYDKMKKQDFQKEKEKISEILLKMNKIILDFPKNPTYKKEHVKMAIELRDSLKNFQEALSNFADFLLKTNPKNYPDKTLLRLNFHRKLLELKISLIKLQKTVYLWNKIYKEVK